jgi:hypothetical protein
MDIDLTAYVGLSGATIVVILVQLVKNASGMTEEMQIKYLPFVSILMGIAWNALILLGMAQFPRTSSGFATMIVIGLLTGLAASGLYSGVKNYITPKQ